MSDLITQVRGQLLKLQNTYDSLRRYETTDAPQLKNLQSRIDATKQQVAKLQTQMTSTKLVAKGEQSPLSGSMSRLDYFFFNY